MSYDAKRLDDLGAKYKRLRGQLDELRPELVDAIRAAVAAGVRQVDIARKTGYTREMIRRIAGGE